MDNLIDWISAGRPVSSSTEVAAHFKSEIDKGFITVGDAYEICDAKHYSALQTAVGPNIRFTNHYKCVCGETWQDDSTSTNNDRCPVCDKEIEPFSSIQYEDE